MDSVRSGSSRTSGSLLVRCDRGLGTTLILLVALLASLGGLRSLDWKRVPCPAVEQLKEAHRTMQCTRNEQESAKYCNANKSQTSRRPSTSTEVPQGARASCRRTSMRPVNIDKRESYSLKLCYATIYHQRPASRIWPASSLFGSANIHLLQFTLSLAL